MSLESPLILAEGFAVIPGVLGPNRIAQIESHIRDLSCVGTRCLLVQDWCASLARDLCSSLASKLSVLADLVAVQCTYFNKVADKNWFVGFHQDLSVPVDPSTPRTLRGWSQKEGMTFVQPDDDLMAKMIVVRLHIDDCSAENGPLRVIPGSHVHGTLSRPEVAQLTQTSAQELYACSGSVIVMSPLLLHASSRSTTSKPRRVLHFLYGPRCASREFSWRHAV